MKTILLKNTRDIILYFLGQLAELILRIIRFSIPVGIYNYVLQMSTKPRSTTAIGTYLTPKSTFMFVAPGTILVSVEGDLYKSFFSNKKAQWNRNFPTYFIVLQCIAYLCITIYFISSLIRG